MRLAQGSRLGAYEVVAAVGAGGMGEVYRARDTALNRDVALKVLPSSVAADRDRLARFRREAQALASLNHPHIAQIYGFDESTATPVLVMEFVGGKTLDELIRNGPVPIDEVRAIGAQIAEALEAAHDAGIIHRDLKPANVKVRDDGTVKVLDFGLAKAFDSAQATADPANSPTLTHQATVAGIILGTAAYMAPEQAKGRGVDKRADIWAFGCVLYEMLTGERQFGGDTVQETLAAVIKDAPRFDRLPDAVPSSIRRLLGRCLDRDPRTRLRDIGEARVALSRPDEPETTARPSASRPARSRTGLFAAASIAFAAVVGVLAWQLKPAPAAAVRRFELPVVLAGVHHALSTDGSRLAYVSKEHLYVHDFGTGSDADLGQLPPAATYLFWSPDGQAIGYGAGGAIRTRPVSGGPDFTVCKVPGAGRLTDVLWRRDNTILFAAWRDSIYSVPAVGGTPAVVTAVDTQTDVDFHALTPLPDGRLIVARHNRSDDAEYLEIRDGATIVPLTDDRTIEWVRYVSPGYLFFIRRGANKGMWAVPFDKPPIDFAKAILIAAGATSLVAADDTAVAFTTASPKAEWVWVTPAGAIGPVPGGAVVLDGSNVSLSPDGNRAAFIAGSGTDAVVVVRDLQTGVDARLTVPTGNAAQQTNTTRFPRWFPTGHRILYSYGPAETMKVWTKDVTGGGPARELVPGFFAQISPNSREIYSLTDERGRGRLYRAPLSADGTAGAVSPVMPADESNQGLFDISPDGSLLAYEVRQATGQINVWVTDLPKAEGRWQVTTDGGTQPRFSRDGRSLFYTGSGSAPGAAERSGALFVVPIASQPAVSLGVRRQLFTLNLPAGASATGGYDIAPDGRLLMSRPSTSNADPPKAELIQNWLELVLRRRE